MTKSETELVAVIAAVKKEWSFDYNDAAARARAAIVTRVEALL
ncbi:hypothetical protein [Burkholderia ubonensis]|nr:hypothetical protein [Burkholderia ubonensis]